MDNHATDRLVPLYGMHAVDYADVWPDLTEALRKLYLDKTYGIQWLPANWRASVNALHGDKGKLLLPVRSFAVSSTGEGPRFLDTPEKKAWWNDFHAKIQAAHQAFMNKERSKGLALMNSAYADTAFWTKAYNIASVLALPVTAVRGVANFAGMYPKLVQGALIGGVALLAWYFLRRRK